PALEKAGGLPTITRATTAGRALLAGADPLAPFATAATLLEGARQADEMTLALAAARARVDPEAPGPAVDVLLGLLAGPLGDEAGLALVEVATLPGPAVERLLKALGTADPALVRRAAYILPRSGAPPARV